MFGWDPINPTKTSGIGSSSKLGGSYLSYQDTFVWRKIIFLWSDSKNWGCFSLLWLPLFCHL